MAASTDRGGPDRAVPGRNWVSSRPNSVSTEESALRVDAEVRLADVQFRAVKELDRLGPFGEDNWRPTFAADRVELDGPPKTMGEGDRHLQLRLRHYGKSMRAIAFGRGEWAEEIARVDGPLSVCFAPSINTFNGYSNVELQLIDWRPADEPAPHRDPASTLAGPNGRPGSWTGWAR